MSVWTGLLAILLASTIRSSDGAAGGTTTYCAHTDSYLPPGGGNRAAQGAAPCANGLTECGTMDRWGNDATTCKVPGFRPIAQPPNLGPVFNPGYPGTVDQSNVCNNAIFTSPLVGADGVEYATVMMFKDYQDMLYVTVQVKPTFTSTLPGVSPPGANGMQWLHSQPSPPVPFNQYTPATPLSRSGGQVHVSNVFIPSLPAAYVNQLSATSFSQFASCFTYQINLAAVCEPSNTKHWVTGFNASGSGCVKVSPSLPGPSEIDMRSTQNLYVAVEFDLTLQNLGGGDTLGVSCGASTTTVRVRMPGSGTVDLYSPSPALGQVALPRSCGGITSKPPSPPNQPAPPSPPLPPSPPPAPIAPPTPPLPPTEDVYSMIYINSTNFAYSPASCSQLEAILEPFLLGRFKSKVGCQTYSQGPWSVIYHKVKFTNVGDRDYFFQTAANLNLWQTIYSGMSHGCDFFGAYTQTSGVFPPFTEPNWAYAPSSAPFTSITIDNPYVTACSASIQPGPGIPGVVPLKSGGVASVYGWVPPQSPAFLQTYNLGGVGTMGQNWGINTLYYNSGPLPPNVITPYLTPCTHFIPGSRLCNQNNGGFAPPPPLFNFNPPPTFTTFAPPSPPFNGFFQPPPPLNFGVQCTVTARFTKIATAGVRPFDIATDPTTAATSLELFCGQGGIRSVLGGVLFRPIDVPTASQIQVRADLGSVNDQMALANCLVGNLAGIKIISNNFRMECTDQIRMDYSCVGAPPTIFTGDPSVPGSLPYLDPCKQPPPNPFPPPPSPPLPPFPPPPPPPIDPPSPPPPVPIPFTITINGAGAICSGLNTALGNVLAATGKIGALIGSSVTSIFCVPSGTNSVILSAPFVSPQEAEQALDALVNGNILIAAFITQAGVRCGSTLTTEVPATGKRTVFTCENLFSLCCPAQPPSPSPSPSRSRSPPPPAGKRGKKSPPPPPQGIDYAPPPSYMYGPPPAYGDYPPWAYYYGPPPGGEYTPPPAEYTPPPPSKKSGKKRFKRGRSSN